MQSSHWQAGGWFGSQLGGTAWLFVSAAVLARESLASAGVVLGAAVAVNLLGLALWARRERLDPFRALQVLVLAVGVTGAAVTHWLDARGQFALLDPRVSPRSMYTLLAVLSFVLVAVFEVKRRGARFGGPSPT